MKALARRSLGKIRLDYSSTNVTTSAWVELSSALPDSSNLLEIFDSSGSVLKLSSGTAGNEAASELLFYILPGGNSGLIPVELSKNSRLSIKAVDVSATVGQICINIYGANH